MMLYRNANKSSIASFLSNDDLAPNFQLNPKEYIPFQVKYWCYPSEFVWRIFKIRDLHHI